MNRIVGQKNHIYLHMNQIICFFAPYVFFMPLDLEGAWPLLYLQLQASGFDKITLECDNLNIWKVTLLLTLSKLIVC